MSPRPALTMSRLASTDRWAPAALLRRLAPPMCDDPSLVMAESQSRGFLNTKVVQRFAFWTTTACIVVATVASILAIWQFTGTDALWRTVATCAVIGVATLACSFVNGLFAPPGNP
jgi:hypothetical protein